MTPVGKHKHDPSADDAWARAREAQAFLETKRLDLIAQYAPILVGLLDGYTRGSRAVRGLEFEVNGADIRSLLHAKAERSDADYGAALRAAAMFVKADAVHVLSLHDLVHLCSTDEPPRLGRPFRIDSEFDPPAAPAREAAPKRERKREPKADAAAAPVNPVDPGPPIPFPAVASVIAQEAHFDMPAGANT